MRGHTITNMMKNTNKNIIKNNYKYARVGRMGVSEGLERELGAKVSGHRISLLIISSIKCPLFRRKTPRIFQHRKNSGESAPLGMPGGPK